MKIKSKINIVGLFYYTGHEIIAENNLVISGQFDFMLVKTLIFDEIKENSTLFNNLSEILELKKWHTVKLECAVSENNKGKYYNIVNCFIFKEFHVGFAYPRNNTIFSYTIVRITR